MVTFEADASEDARPGTSPIKLFRALRLDVLFRTAVKFDVDCACATAATKAPQRMDLANIFFEYNCKENDTMKEMVQVEGERTTYLAFASLTYL